MSQRRHNVVLKKTLAWRVCSASALAILIGTAMGGCGGKAAEQLPAGPSRSASADVLEAPGAMGATKRNLIDTAVSTPPVASANQSTAEPLTVDELVKLAGEPCETSLQGNRCMSEESDFELTPDCAAHGYYAVVKNPHGASLFSRVPPRNNVVRSTLSSGQLVCVQAVAWIKTYPSYVFVTAVAHARQEDCHNCNGYGTREITWRTPHADGLCVQTAPGRFEGDCAVGWADGDDMKLLGRLSN